MLCQNNNLKDNEFFVANLAGAVKMQLIIGLTKDFDTLLYSIRLAMANSKPDSTANCLDSLLQTLPLTTSRYSGSRVHRPSRAGGKRKASSYVQANDSLPPKVRCVLVKAAVR